MAGAAEFIGTDGVPGLVCGVRTGIIGGFARDVAFQTVHAAITADTFEPSSPDIAAELASVLGGYSRLGSVERAAVTPRITSLLMENEVDVHVAIEELRAAGSIAQLQDAGGLPVALPFVEEISPGFVMARMPEGRIGATSFSGKGGKVKELFIDDVEIILASIVSNLLDASPEMIRFVRNEVVFGGLTREAKVMIVNDDGSALTDLDTLISHYLDAHAKRSPGGELPVHPVVYLRRRLVPMIQSGSETRPDRLGSIAVSSKRRLVLPGVGDVKRGRWTYIGVDLPAGMELGRVKGVNNDLADPDLATIELIFTALVKKFGHTYIQSFGRSLLREYVESGDGQRTAQNSIYFFEEGKPLRGTVRELCYKGNILANIYAEARGLSISSRAYQRWSLLLMEKVVSEILKELS